MVSRGVVALLLAVLAQAATANPINCNCACNVPQVEWRETCCPGPVVEKNVVVNRPKTETFTYSEPTFSKQCYQVPAGVAKSVVPKSYESAPVCDTLKTLISLPTTEVEKVETPLCRTTCTTSEYLITIPIQETTCTSHPLCKQTVRTQDNVLQTVSEKTNCFKDFCTQNIVSETPITETRCQNYQGSINKVGTQTVIVPEVHTECVQLPPYKCSKPVVGNSVETFSFGGPYGAYGPGSIVGSGPIGAGFAEYTLGGYPGYGSYAGFGAFPGVGVPFGGVSEVIGFPGGFGYEGFSDVYNGFPGFSYGPDFADFSYGAYPGYGYGGFPEPYGFGCGLDLVGAAPFPTSYGTPCSSPTILPYPYTPCGCGY